VGVNLEGPEKPQFYIEGNVGALDYVTIQAATHNLQKFFEKQEIDELTTVQDTLVENFETQGFVVKPFNFHMKEEKLKKFKGPKPGDKKEYAKKDYTVLASKYGVDYLINIHVKRLGIARKYYGFMPTDEPRVVVDVDAVAINLENNKLMWSTTYRNDTYPEGKWKVKPDYPVLDKAFHRALVNANKRVVASVEKDDVE
jgi:hypothetical protein